MIKLILTAFAILVIFTILKKVIGITKSLISILFIIVIAGSIFFFIQNSNKNKISFPKTNIAYGVSFEVTEEGTVIIDSDKTEQIDISIPLTAITNVQLENDLLKIDYQLNGELKTVSLEVPNVNAKAEKLINTVLSYKKELVTDDTSH